MDLKELQWNWDTMGKEDPLWSILTNEGMRGNKWDPEAFFMTGTNKIKSVFQYLENLNIIVHYGSALDFGCGVGRLTLPLAEKFELVTGVDIAASMLQLAHKFNKYPDRCRYHHNTKNDLSFFQDNSFDFVITFIVLQHMRPEFAKNYIREFVRVLKSSGVAVFQVPTIFKGPVYISPKLNIIQKIKNRWRQFIRFFGIQPSVKPAKHAHMEMYGTPTQDLLIFLNKLPVEVLDVKMDTHTASSWESNQYIIRKK